MKTIVAWALAVGACVASVHGVLTPFATDAARLRLGVDGGMAAAPPFTRAVLALVNGASGDGRSVGGDIMLDPAQVPIGGGFFPYAVIPQPAFWAMLIAGFGLVGVAMRSARRGFLLPT